jgi:hypothetical protein
LGTITTVHYSTCCTRNTQYTTSSTTTTTYTIPTSWLTTSTIVSTIALSGVGLDNMSTVTTVTAAVGMLATRADWTGFPQSTSTGGSGTGESGCGIPKWCLTDLGINNPASIDVASILGPVVSAIATLTTLVGIAYLFLCHRRRQPRRREEEGEAWSAKPELPPEGLSSVSPQELDADQQIAQMAANEIAALELDVEVHHHEMDSEPHHWELDSPESGKGKE